MNARTLVDVFREVEKRDKPDLFLVKKEGRWQPISAREFTEQVRAISAALGLFGVEQGGRVALLSENRPEWSIVDFACQCYGAVLVPIFPTMMADQVEYLLKDSGATVAFASNVTQLTKILDSQPNCPKLTTVISFDDPNPLEVKRFESVLEEGRKALAADPEAFDKRALSRQPDELATLIYTSGTTGEPKGAMLTHGNFVSNMLAGCSILPLGDDEVALSFLPTSHVFERLIEYCYFHRGATIAYAESIEKLRDNLQEIHPTCFGAVPRVYEKVYARIQENAEKASPAKKKLFAAAIAVGKEVLELKIANKTPGAILALKHFAFERLVYRKIRGALGSRFKYAISGGAPLAKDLAEFFWAVGVQIYEGYGLTETSPVIALNSPTAWRLGSVGKIVPGVEAKIAPDGEILARGPNIMKGYLNKPEATKEAIDADGWFHTGDIGMFDEDGFLKITDRKKEILVNSNGKNIAPAPIEGFLKGDPFISQPVLIGDRRKFLTCLIVPNFEKLAEWAKSNGVNAKTTDELLVDPKVRGLYQKTIETWNKGKAHEQIIGKFALLSRELSIEEGELTPTLKVKRRIIDQKYKSVIDGLYAGSD
ncbi:MAG: long-chain fatty acid--CoA ligase [Thermoanaerobaculia bacterium]